MAELFVSKPTNHHHRHHLLFPDFELLEPPPIFQLPFPNVLRPFRRGPMYSSYAKLRDRMRRLKRARNAPSTPIPLPLKRSGVFCSVDRSSSLSKENRKPAQRSDTFMTPPPPIASKPDLRKSVSVSVGRMEEKKSRPGGTFSVRRSFLGMNELKEIPMVSVSGIKEEGREARSGNKGSLRKSVTGLERSKLMKAMG